MAVDSIKISLIIRFGKSNGGYRRRPHLATAHTAKRYLL